MRHAGMQVIMGNGNGTISGILRKLRLLRVPAHFLLAAPKAAALRTAAILRWQNACDRTAGFSRHSARAKQKAIPYGMAFCFGGDKRDRTADLMTASCYRFVIFGVFYVKYVRSVNEKCGISQNVVHCVHTPSHTLESQSGSGELGGFGEVLPGGDVDCNLNFVDSQVMKEKKSPHAQHSSPRFTISKVQSVLRQKYKMKTIKNTKFILTMPSRYSIL